MQLDGVTGPSALGRHMTYLRPGRHLTACEAFTWQGGTGQTFTQGAHPHAAARAQKAAVQKMHLAIDLHRLHGDTAFGGLAAWDPALRRLHPCHLKSSSMR
jgi:hypothetical protein